MRYVPVELCDDTRTENIVVMLRQLPKRMLCIRQTQIDKAVYKSDEIVALWLHADI
jgi:hypothetical protein